MGNDDLKNLAVGVIGEQTAQAAREHGFNVEFVANTSNAEAFAGEFIEYLQNKSSSFSGNIYILRGKVANTNLEKQLAEANFKVFPIVVYESRVHEVSAEEVERFCSKPPDMIVLTSSQAAKNLVQILNKPEKLKQIPVAVIGPKTAQTVEQLGLNLSIVAEKTFSESLVQGIIGFFSSSEKCAK